MYKNNFYAYITYIINLKYMYHFSVQDKHFDLRDFSSSSQWDPNSQVYKGTLIVGYTRGP